MIARTTRRMLGGAAAAFDRAATAAAYAGAARTRQSAAESLGHEERMTGLAALAASLEGVEIFPPARSALPTERPVKRGVVDLSWPSPHAHVFQDLEKRYARPRNDVAAARLFFGSEARRPVIVCIHGYLGGQFTLEEHAFPVKWLQRIGLDVALFVLPFHGVRADPRRSGPPPFPGADPRVTIEGFRHAMADLSGLTTWLLERGHPSVGLTGMSLGGYSTALAATVDARWSFAIPIIPLASIADFARDQGRLGHHPDETAAQHAALERAYAPVSPLHRSSLIAPERVLVIGAKADRITPVTHARRLASHFGARLDSWHGGHLLQFGRSDAFRRVGRFLNEIEVVKRSG